MAEEHQFPYPNFAFRVKIGTDNGKGILAGFQEVSGVGMEVAISEYRPGNYKEAVTQKIMGLGKTPDVTLKRGVLGATDLFAWIKQLRDGDRKQAFSRDVIIQMLAEDRDTVILEWKLINARPMKYTGPALNGKSSDVAIEEMVLSCENIEMTAV